MMVINNKNNNNNNNRIGLESSVSRWLRPADLGCSGSKKLNISCLLLLLLLVFLLKLISLFFIYFIVIDTLLILFLD